MPAARDTGASVMTTAIILILSGALIGAGLTIMLRDMLKSRRAFVSLREGPAASGSDVEITISQPVSQEAASIQRPDAGIVPPAADVAADPAPSPPQPREPPPADSVTHPLERQWSALQVPIAASVAWLNARLEPARLSIGEPGEPAWSYKNRGYGGYRRLLFDGASVAWLRLELAADGLLYASVKAHKDDWAAVNARADAPAEGLDANLIGVLLLRCLQPAIDRVAPKDPGRDGEQAASEQAWRSVDALVASALKASNGALSQAGARLVPVTPAVWEAELRRHRMPLRVELDGSEIARMLIERLPHEMEVAVGLRDAQLADLGRRRRVPVDGLTVHALAELIAGCAWPAIARFREIRRPA